LWRIVLDLDLDLEETKQKPQQEATATVDTISLSDSRVESTMEKRSDQPDLQQQTSKVDADALEQPFKCSSAVALSTVPLLFDSKPSFTALQNLHKCEERSAELCDLVPLKDGSFLSVVGIKSWIYMKGYPVSRWSVEGRLQMVGLYKGHSRVTTCAIEVDDNTFITGALDATLKVWNKTTCECLSTIAMKSNVLKLLRCKRDPSLLLCLLVNNSVEVLELSQHCHVYTVDIKHTMDINTMSGDMIELDDGTIVIMEYFSFGLNRWDMSNRTKLQTFRGHTNQINKVIQLRRDVIVSASLDHTVKMWNVSSGECIYTLSQHSGAVCSLIWLSERHFASGSRDKTVRVWDENGNNIATYQSECRIESMTLLRDGSLVVGDVLKIEIRRR